MRLLIMFSPLILTALILRLTIAYIWMVILRENWTKTNDWFHAAALLYILWMMFSMIGIVGNASAGSSTLAIVSYTIGNGIQVLLALVVRKTLSDFSRLSGL